VLRQILAVLAVWLTADAIAAGDARAVELPEGFSTVEQVTGPNSPTAVAYTPDGRLLIAEKAGRVRVVDADGLLHLESGLTARDSTGLEASTNLSMHPETIAMGMESSPPGAVLSYAGVDGATSALRTAAIGFHTSVSAPSVLETGSRRLVFARWSDGGARLHDIVLPARGFTLTAYYEPVPSAGPPSGLLPVSPPLPLAPSRAGSFRVEIAAGRPVRRLRGRVVGAPASARVDVACGCDAGPRAAAGGGGRSGA
jgi:hypothetical protein